MEIDCEGAPSTTRLRLQMLGPLRIESAQGEVPLPKSRKVRALLAYLALSPREVTRSALCELLWDAPSDPRGELRWCLSRIRKVLDDETCARVVTRGDGVSLDSNACMVDVSEVARLTSGGVDALSLPQLLSLAKLFRGEFLEGLEIDDSPLFSHWLSAERRRLRLLHAALLREIVKRTPRDDDNFVQHVEEWLKADPFDRTAHELLLQTLVARGRVRDAEEHLAAAIRSFEQEGLEWFSIREAWRAARAEQSSPAVQVMTPPTTQVAQPGQAASPRASICVLPFLEYSIEGHRRSSIGDGIADDIITRLAKLRVLFVIARGTAFSLADRKVEAEEIARILNVDFLTNGSVRRVGNRIHVRVELVDTRAARIVWADEFSCAADETLDGLEDIGNGIVASITEEIESVERNRAILKPPSSLDAWEAYHRGLWHMYRFSATDNDKAAEFFRLSSQLDPTFARAYAGLSFTHFQNAFLLRPAERQVHMNLAYEAAGQSLMADDRDPAAHWSMGRALWLRGEESEALSELSKSVDLSPNFALGHYTLGFVHCQSGDPRYAIVAADQSRRLSPFDPLQFAMLASRAIAHVRLEQFDDAAMWAVKAAARPNAHAHILAIAAHCLVLARRTDEARIFADRIRAGRPDYKFDDYLRAFRFAPDAERLFRSGAREIGFL